ncbi:putative fatty acyl-CoA reductase CG5065 [Bradysia coprophila]|uniref:putative fatty acyl-CoA reductase CG5065 n=1 Tax=Bradysia coprophila TaxID=38358 RepID=UPI00187D918D|nr:putative fatty acyl-CoA reductase CG5065 [Bradysia coprophila]
MVSLAKVGQGQSMQTTDRVEGTYISIPQFYASRSVFITGGTGFMGKILVEKLLRSCPEIENIYLLMRPKRGQDVSSRLNDLLNSNIYDTIRREKLDDLKKVVPIRGDVTLMQLGISESDQELLCRNVSVVYHLAATIKFDEKLELAAKINMLGTRSLLELCRRMTHLDALVHVSTAFCNCDRSEIQEIVYPPPYDPADIINLVRWLPEDILEKMTPLLIGKRPNTYTFTKALTEQMILKEAGSLPVAIVRPSIVVACYKEPTPGWLDCFSGPTYLLAAIGNGVLRTVMLENDFLCDMVPVDFVSNMMITISWRTATAKPRRIIVYNCVNSNRQPITWSQFVNNSLTHIIRHPLEGVIWYPTAILHTNRLKHTILHYLVHYLPAYVLDLVSWSVGKRQIMVKTQNRLTEAAEIGRYFVTNQWYFTDDNMRELLTFMSSSDRNTFQFDVTQINWNSFYEPFAVGLRTFVFKQNPKSLPNSRKRMTRLYLLHQTSKFLLASCTIISVWRSFVYLRGAFR